MNGVITPGGDHLRALGQRPHQRLRKEIVDRSGAGQKNRMTNSTRTATIARSSRSRSSISER
jgi:hypothetical protein